MKSQNPDEENPKNKKIIMQKCRLIMSKVIDISFEVVIISMSKTFDIGDAIEKSN